MFVLNPLKMFFNSPFPALAHFTNYNAKLSLYNFFIFKNSSSTWDYLDSFIYLGLEHSEIWVLWLALLILEKTEGKLIWLLISFLPI